MTGHEIRTAFLEFFRSKGHEIVPSSRIVPEDDPTILFANAGMNQFKNCFLGAEKRSYTRATSSQKCIRISGKHNDLENVGVTARHHTFFEMLGNFSFGDYFKKEAIEYAWEFVTEVLGLSKDRLWVTIFEDDDEAATLWATHTDVNKDRILRYGEKDNFWAMGDTGPCGPCSEIFYYLGDDVAGQNEADFRLDDGTYIEFWNLVFMQYERASDGSLNPLPAPSIDTGAGLERIAAIVQGVQSNYDTDLLREIIRKVEQLSGFAYGGSSYQEKDITTDKNYARDVAMRVIADHSRTVSFLIADGVNPGSDGRGYVLRRVIRRAVRHGRSLEFSEPFMAKTCESVIEMMGSHYPELKEREDLILKLVDAEERKFHETLDAGLGVLHGERTKLSAGQLFSGESAFLLHDTYGFPLDLTQDVLKGYGNQVDVETFNSCMAQQKKRSREDRDSKAITFTTVKVSAPKTEFLGYEQLEAESKLVQVVNPDDSERNLYKKGDSVSLFFEATPFYGESGGQVGDTGQIKFKDAVLTVVDTQKVQNDFFLHHCEVAAGKFSLDLKGQTAQLSVDTDRRSRIMVNHSATHLVHSALRTVLGDHVKQAGSRVDGSTLRFDYSHFAPVTTSQIEQIQSIINSEIRANYQVVTNLLPIKEAKKTGAIALFGEKYGDKVRVVEMGPDSIEFCGGTHVSRSGDIGFCLVDSETGISAGVRRIQCYAGAGAVQEYLAERTVQRQIAQLVKSSEGGAKDKVEKLVVRVSELEKALEQQKSRLASTKNKELINHARTTPAGVKVIAERIDGADAQTLRSMVDDLRSKLGSGVVALGGKAGSNVIMVAGVTKDLTKRLSAGALLKEAIKVSGGKGGGKADFAQAGGGDPGKLQDALDHLFGTIQ